MRRGHDCGRCDRRAIVARRARCQHSDVDTRTETRVARRLHPSSELRLLPRCDSASVQERLDDDSFIAAQAQGGEGERREQRNRRHAGHDSEPASSRVRRTPQHEPRPPTRPSVCDPTVCIVCTIGNERCPNRSPGLCRTRTPRVQTPRNRWSFGRRRRASTEPQPRSKRLNLVGNWWTRTQSTRTAGALPFEVALLETAERPGLPADRSQSPAASRAWNERPGDCGASRGDFARIARG